MAHRLVNPPFAVDALLRFDGRTSFSGESRNLSWQNARAGMALARGAERGWYVSPPVGMPFPVSEVLPSWNVDLDEARQGYRVHIRVRDAAGAWSPWFYLGSGGAFLSPPPAKPVRESASWGMVDEDHLLLKRPALALQFRVALKNRGGRGGVPVLKAFGLAVTNTQGDRALWESHRDPTPLPPGEAWARTLPMPYRSQLWVKDRGLAGQICCPTCISMVLESHGVDISTEQAAANAFDPENGIYGNWPRAAQSVVRHGLESWVQRFRTGDDVKRMIARGMPVVASIQARRGELRNARYPRTSGHLILIRGMTADGDFVVNDPYSEGPEGAEIVYKKEDIGKVWLDRGGVGIVIRRPGKENRSN